MGKNNRFHVYITWELEKLIIINLRSQCLFMETREILIFIAVFLAIAIALVVAGLYFLFSYWNNSELRSPSFSYELSQCKSGEWIAHKHFGFDYINYSVIGIASYRNTTVCHAVANVVKTDSKVTDHWYWTDEEDYCYNTTTVYSNSNRTDELCIGKWPGY
jgi:hypothetical protein